MSFSEISTLKIEGDNLVLILQYPLPFGGVFMADGEFWILALSGGGARGLFTAQVIANFEKEIGSPLAQHFDLIAGTSVGGILALGLAKEISGEKLTSLFDKAENIFVPRNFLSKYFPFHGPKYRSDGLKALLMDGEIFGDSTIGNLKHRVMIPSVNYTKGTPTFFKTPHHPTLRTDWEYSLVDVAMATSAAPTFFPAYGFSNQYFVDGGLVANAPGLVAVHEAMNFVNHPDVKTIHVVSIGTFAKGSAMDPKMCPNIGILTTRNCRCLLPTRGWGFRLFDLTINSQESMSNYMLNHWLDDHHYLIDGKPKPEQTNYLDLDDTSQESQRTLIGQANVVSQELFSPQLLSNIKNHKPLQPIFYYGPNKNISN